MKHETSNLLIGLGIGAVVGVAVGYLMVADNRKKLAEEFDRAVSKVKEEVKDVYSKAKNKAENVKEHVLKRLRGRQLRKRSNSLWRILPRRRSLS